MTPDQKKSAETPEERAVRKARKRFRRLTEETEAAGPPPENETPEEKAARKDRKRARRQAEQFAVEAEKKLEESRMAKTAPKKASARSKRPGTAIVVVAKNEGVYLHEWLAYHKLLGFDEILIYDNDSTDGSTELLGELRGHELATPTEWHVEADVSPQIAGYTHALERLGPDFGWVAFIDLDEFLVLPQHETIGDFVADFERPDALGINWKNFGSSGLADYCARARYRSIQTLL